MSLKEDRSPLEVLDSLVEDSPGVRRAARRERLRLELARFMKKAREEAGLSQQDVARVLGVTQAWVSKLENSNHDHKLESVLSYFDAVGAEMSLGVEVGAATFQIWGSAPTFPFYDLSVEEVDVGALLTSASVAWREFEDVVQWWQVPEVETGLSTQSGQVVSLEDYVKDRALRTGEDRGPREASAT